MSDEDPLTSGLEFDVLVLVTEGNLMPGIQHEIESAGLLVTAQAMVNIMKELGTLLDQAHPGHGLDWRK